MPCWIFPPEFTGARMVVALPKAVKLPKRPWFFRLRKLCFSQPQSHGCCYTTFDQCESSLNNNSRLESWETVQQIMTASIRFSQLVRQLRAACSSLLFSRFLPKAILVFIVPSLICHEHTILWVIFHSFKKRFTKSNAAVTLTRGITMWSPNSTIY